MPKKTTNLLKLAKPSIEEALKQFIKDPTAAKDIRQVDKKGATELFMHCLNDLGYQSLIGDEKNLFEHYYDLEGKDHRDFSQIFGPDKIAENVAEFVGYFLIRKVMMPGDQMAEAAKVVAHICKWLVEKNLVSDARDAIEKAERAAELLPRAEEANRIIWELSQKCPQNAEEYFDSGYMTVKRIEKNTLWLEGDDGEEIGPIALPVKAARLLQPDWKINCSLAKSRGKWFFAEVGNVYPD